MKTIKLSKWEIEITEDKMKWGEKELVRFTLVDSTLGIVTPESMLNSKIKRFEFAIKNIRGVDGKKIPFSKEWVMSLEEEDGILIVEHLNSVDQKKNIASTEEKSQETKEPVK